MLFPADVVDVIILTGIIAQAFDLKSVMPGAPASNTNWSLVALFECLQDASVDFFPGP